MKEAERIKKIKRMFAVLDKTVLLMGLTTRLMRAFVKQIDRDTARRLKEGGEKK